MNLSEALLHALKAQGAKEIFGIPGDFVLPFFKIIEESNLLPLYTLSHEPAVGFAADAAARMHMNLGVAAVTYGAGALNMVNAIATAYAERSPVVVISGAPGEGESQKGLLLHHQAKTLSSQFRIYSEITCDQARLDDVHHAPQDIARVLCHAHLYSQPVYIELPRDKIHQSCEEVPIQRLPAIDKEALRMAASEIMTRLTRAKKPVLMICVETRRYGLETKVAKFARKLGIPVVTSLMGRGLFAGMEPPLIGPYLGIAGDKKITRLVEHSDALFLLGIILSDTNFGISKEPIDLKKTIQATRNQVIIDYHVYPYIPLSSLIDELLRLTEERNDAPATVFPKIRYPRNLKSDDHPIHPIDIATAVNDLFDTAGRMPIVADMGDALFTAFDIENTTLLAPAYYATMGFGIPAGLGLQATTGKRPLILVGDGAFQMTGLELGNCKKYGWDPIVLVFNNSSWEMLAVFQPGSKFNKIDGWNFAEIAMGLKGVGIRVTTRRELHQALFQAVQERGRFHLLDIVIPPGKISPTLSNYVSGIRRLSRNP
ncbi:MAG: indolepyruvate/phenylpyruvate decarboxylase [Gammaproteobacteria bacterium]|nr:indolepyruvate/phenylpyruvate decarboxylase [Gammaproteobacteria bacterium]